MPAYAIVHTTVVDPEQYARYRALAQVTVAAHGGRYLVRGGEIACAEGEWPADTSLVVIEFPSMRRLQEWYASPGYVAAREVAKVAVRRTLAFVEGYSDVAQAPVAT
jgi:uncharacterized protein (DUF1330 family)